jgi:hypothetical protein
LRNKITPSIVPSQAFRDYFSALRDELILGTGEHIIWMGRIGEVFDRLSEFEVAMISAATPDDGMRLQ